MNSLFLRPSTWDILQDTIPGSKHQNMSNQGTEPQSVDSDALEHSSSQLSEKSKGLSSHTHTRNYTLSLHIQCN